MLSPAGGRAGERTGMTALNEYQRLETSAIWRASPQDQRRDVIVSVGDATLVVHDGAGRPLAHWSLPAVERLNPGLRPALYRPGPDSPEELELTDPEMIAAIGRIQAAVERRRPHKGRLRYVLLAGALAALAAAALLWLPDALVRHAATVVPPAKRADLGARLLSEIRGIAGAPCGGELGRRALDQLETRLLDGRGRLIVLRGGIPPTTHLPGGTILIDRALVETTEDPGIVAGYILAEAERLAREDPVETLLRRAGPIEALRLLTTGDLSDAALADFAGTLVDAAPEPVPDGALLRRFKAADVPATPYAFAVDPTGERTLALIEADPVDPVYAAPVLRDAEWVSLQGICGE